MAKKRVKHLPLEKGHVSKMKKTQNEERPTGANPRRTKDTLWSPPDAGVVQERQQESSGRRLLRSSFF
jgi:hypothetical protein